MLRKFGLLTLALVALVAVLEASRAQGQAGQIVQSSLVPVAALAVSLVSIIVAFSAVRRARRTQSDFQRLSRSLEMALRDLSSRTERDAASIGELNRKIGEEIEALTASHALDQASRDVASGASEQPEPRESREIPSHLQITERVPELDFEAPETVQSLLVRAVEQSSLEVSLQPIISVAQSAAAGFEVHAHIESPEDGRPFDIRRLAQPVAGLDPVRFESEFVRAAISAGRRQLGTATERMPFHVAISEALLGSGREVSAIAEMARVHRALASSIVFSLPARLFEAGGETRERIDMLTEAGYRLAAEGWEGDAEAASALRSRGVQFVKVSTNRLLDRERVRRRAPQGAEIANGAVDAGMSVIATAVVRDEDAVGLIDLGIDLMVGDRFSGPRRIRSASARQTVLAAS